MHGQNSVHHRHQPRIGSEGRASSFSRLLWSILCEARILSVDGRLTLADTLGIVHYFCDDFGWMACRCCGGWSTFGIGWEPQLASISGAVEFREFFGPKCSAEKRCTNRTYPKWSNVFVVQFFLTKTLNVVVFFLWLTMNPTQAQWNLNIKSFRRKKTSSLSIWNAVYLDFPLTNVVLKLGDDADACCLFPLGGGHCGQFVGVPWASFRMMGLVVLVVLVEHWASWSYREPRGF